MNKLKGRIDKGRIDNDSTQNTAKHSIVSEMELLPVQTDSKIRDVEKLGGGRWREALHY